MTPLVIVMGVSGSGKSVVGAALAARWGCPFYDGDDYHPPANIAKMSATIPLNDEDRLPWLQTLRGLLAEHQQRETSAVLACSALKRRYRILLSEGLPSVVFVYLHADYESIAARMQARSTHFMKANMLRSQFEALEAPTATEAIHVDATQPLEQTVTQLSRAIAGA